MNRDMFEADLAASLRQRAVATPTTTPPIERVISRSRQRTARRRGATSAAIATIVLLAGVIVTHPFDTGTTREPGRPSEPTQQDGAGAGGASPNMALLSALQPFESCDELLGWVKAEAKQRVGPYGLDQSMLYAESGRAGVGLGPAEGDSSEFNRSAKQQAPAGAEDPAVASGTNTQESGVDEPDVVKSDGHRIVTLLDGKLSTFTIDGGLPRLAGSIAVPVASTYSGGGHAEPSLLLAGDRALVIDHAYLPPTFAREAPLPQEDAGFSQYRSVPTTVLTQVDLTDLAAPKLLDTVRIAGAYVDSRMVGDTARIVVSSDAPATLTFVYPSVPGDAASEAAAAEANRRIIDESTIDDWTPGYQTGSAYTTEAQQQAPTPLLDCAVVRHPKTFSGLGMVSVLTIDVRAGIDPTKAVGVLATADRVYASTSTLFLSTIAAPLPVVQPGTDVRGTTGTTGTPGTPGTPGTVTGGTAGPPPPPAERDDPHTSIHSFDITGTDPAVYRASGELTGHLLNDFAMSEAGGFLRSATTVPSGQGRPSTESFVSVLHEEDGELRVVGSVGGLGKGEQIKAVRFVGSLGYVVTFRQTDPLYTIDLQDPRNPRVAGELAMLGYSAYLHPVGDGRLLGIGQDATDQGRVTGSQIVLFDVSDPAAPTVLSKLTVPLGSSLAENDYHAFLYWAATSLAVIPVQAYGTADTFTGAVGFTVTPTEVRELARVVNPINYVWCPPGSGCVVPGGVTCDENGACPPPPVPTGDPIIRSMVVGDHVLTLSKGGLLASNLNTLTAETWVPIV